MDFYSSVIFSNSRRNRNRNCRRLKRMICYIEQCADLSTDEKERELERLGNELRKFQPGKQYKSSAVHPPGQFEDKPILDRKTYKLYEDRIKHIVRQLNAGADGAKDEREELHRELAELKGIPLTRKNRAKLNIEMTPKRAPPKVKDRGGKKKRLVKQKTNQSSESEVPAMAQESQSSEETSCQTGDSSTNKFSKRRSAGDRLPSQVCNSGRASKTTGNRKYKYAAAGRGQRHFRSADSRERRKHRKLFSKKAEQMEEQEVPYPSSKQEFERRHDIKQGHVQELINFTSAALLGTHAGFSSILLMLQVFYLFKYVRQRLDQIGIW